MEEKNVFENLKHAFEKAVEYAATNGISEFEETEIQRSKLLTAVANEASRRLKERNVPYQDGLANVITGRRKYQEVTSTKKGHDYQYLQSILSDKDIERLEQAINSSKPIIVQGTLGPTGKTTLVQYLKQFNHNHVVEYDLAEVFTLNQFLKERNPNPFKNSSNAR